MKQSLEHLPEYKQAEIRKIAEIIREVIDPDKIILFGSYAKGEQVDDRYVENGILYEYKSDYDILVITKGNTEKEYVLADKVINKARHITTVAVNLIIHEMDYVNEGLRIGQYFFTDIIKEGVLLYDGSGEGFEEVKELTKVELKNISQHYFDMWYSRGSDFLKLSKECLTQNILNIGAFQLHQSAECYYNTMLLVFTGYKPKTHSLEKLRQYAKPYSKELLKIFPDPTEDQWEFHLFDLLKRGYVDARYKEDYVIKKEELEALIGKVEKMKAVVEREAGDWIENIR